MIGEKIVARNPRRGGSAKDVYDLYRWSERPFNHDLVRRIGVLKVWTRPEEGGWPESDIRETLDTMRSVYERLPADGYFLRVPGMFHLDMTDAPFFSSLGSWPGFTGAIGGDRAHQIINAYSVAFFDRHLRAQPSPLLDGPSERFPEVLFESRRL